MISYASVLEYRRIYPDDICAYNEPGNGVIISNKTTGLSFISPDSESDDTFLDRIARCGKENKNLFYEEWNTFENENGMIY